MAAHGVVSDAEAALFVGQVENHVHPGPVLLGPGCISALGALLEQRIRDLAVDVLLLEAVLVVEVEIWPLRYWSRVAWQKRRS